MGFSILPKSNPEISISDIANEAAHLTGVNITSVFCVLSECKKCSALSSPKKTKICKGVLEDIGNFCRNAIRRKGHKFFFRKNCPLKVLKDGVSTTP